MKPRQATRYVGNSFLGTGEVWADRELLDCWWASFFLLTDRDSFGWGTCNDGALCTAFMILARETGHVEQASLLVNDFALEFVAPINRPNWTIEGAKVRKWIEERLPGAREVKQRKEKGGKG